MKSRRHYREPALPGHREALGIDPPDPLGDLAGKDRVLCGVLAGRERTGRGETSSPWTGLSRGGIYMIQLKLRAEDQQV